MAKKRMTAAERHAIKRAEKAEDTVFAFLDVMDRWMQSDAMTPEVLDSWLETRCRWAEEINRVLKENGLTTDVESLADELWARRSERQNLENSLVSVRESLRTVEASLKVATTERDLLQRMLDRVVSSALKS